jgi:hypothetical protein
MTRRHALGWDQATGWGLPVAGDPLPLRAAGSLGRWLWPIAAVVGFLVVVGYVLGHDDPGPGLSDRGLLALALAAVVLVVLTVRRAAGPGPLARTLAEYALVALLTLLLATASADQQPTSRGEDQTGRQQATERPADRRQATGQADAGPAADRRPGIVRVVTGVWGWLADLWHDADQQTDPHPSPTSTTTPERRARALPPTAAPSTWRLHP